MFYPIPAFIFLGTLILWLKHKDIHLSSDVKLLYLEKMRISKDDFRLVILLGFTVILVVFAYYCINNAFKYNFCYTHTEKTQKYTD